MANVALPSASSPSTSSAASLLPHRSACLRRAASKLSVVAAMGDDPIKEWILTEGKATKITGTSFIGGGCINAAQRYETNAGSFFVKTNRHIGPAMFEGEALGLKAMYDTKSIRVPLPYKAGSLPTGGSFIIMEFIRFGRSGGDQLCEGSSLKCIKLPNLTRAMGSTLKILLEEILSPASPQINTWTADWIEFYSKHRLGYQLELISQQFGDSAIYEKGQQLIENIHPLFEGTVIEPCLLHGDLWSGNISPDTNGDPVMPKQPGSEKRRDLYLLYHYLNHYNLFGSGYRSSAMSIIKDYLLMLKAGDMAASSPFRDSLEVVGGTRGLVAGVRCQAPADMDALFMRRCVELARKAAGHTIPNPMVGCVLVRDGQVIGEGFHPKAGQPHAEVFALRDAGDLAETAPAYVSLEPCNHYGRTPPCTEALIKANVKEVVVGMTDPNPVVASRGIEKLRNAGIDVRVGVEEALCLRLNEAYIHRMLTGKAFATLRAALSMNGVFINQIGSGADQQGGYYSQLAKEYDGVIISKRDGQDDYLTYITRSWRKATSLYHHSTGRRLQTTHPVSRRRVRV